MAGRVAGFPNWRTSEDVVLARVWRDMRTVDMIGAAQAQLPKVGDRVRDRESILRRVAKLGLPVQREALREAIVRGLPPPVFETLVDPDAVAPSPRAEAGPASVPAFERHVPPRRENPPPPPPPVVIHVKAGSLEPGERDLVRKRMQNVVIPQLAAELGRRPDAVLEAIVKLARDGWKPLIDIAPLDHDDVRGAALQPAVGAHRANTRR